MNEEIAPLDRDSRANFNEAARTTAIVSGLAVAEAAFIEMQQCNGQRCVCQDSST
jgi:hypothetical protein